MRALAVEALAPAAVWAVATASAGALATELGPWYRELRKPTWQPPDWVFGPAWTTIFLLAAIAGVLSWSAADATGGYRRALALAYVINGALNVGWSVLFFKLRRPDWALLEVGWLWLSIAGMMAVVAWRAPSAAWLLAPYLLWVGFAAALNYAIVRLNGPFRGR